RVSRPASLVALACAVTIIARSRGVNGSTSATTILLTSLIFTMHGITRFPDLLLAAASQSQNPLF
ncbi:MAG: hypothetical protein NZM31_04415, partial [Gemmatales bacterium]|nr:hypothetical protein [Gemmatales bacterium]MDW8386245.1 hypothetical protein [Gemmatales bacterium]